MKLISTTKPLFVAVAVAVLGACGGGGGGGSSGAAPAISNSIAGYYAGNFTQNSVVYDTEGAVSTNGRGVFASDSASRIYAGALPTSGTAVTSTLRAYDIAYSNSYSVVGEFSTTAAFSGTVSPRVSITGTSTSAGQSASVNLGFSAAVTDQPASLSVIAGTYRGVDADAGDSFTLTLATNGAVTGSDSDGCTYTATLTAPSAAVNVYELNSVSIACPDQPTQVGTGLAVKDGTSILVAINNNDIAAVAYLDAVPAP